MATLAVRPEATTPAPVQGDHVHEADLSEAWFTDHLTKHPGSIILGAKWVTFCAIRMKDWGGPRVDDESSFMNALLFKGWQDELLPLVAWWASLMRRLVFQRCGLECGFGQVDDEGIAAITPTIKGFDRMMTCAAQGLTTSYDSDEPEYCSLIETVGLYRVWTRNVYELACQAMPDRDWSDLEQMV